jgi:hypothetical protein
MIPVLAGPSRIVASFGSSGSDEPSGSPAARSSGSLASG